MFNPLRRQSRKKNFSREDWQKLYEERKALITAFQEIIKTPDGARVFEHLVNACGYHKPVLALDPKTNSVDPMATAYNDGRRSVIVNINELINAEVGTLDEYVVAAKKAAETGELKYGDEENIY